MKFIIYGCVAMRSMESGGKVCYLPINEFSMLKLYRTAIVTETIRKEGRNK